jgi:hypothetical protein
MCLEGLINYQRLFWANTFCIFWANMFSIIWATTFAYSCTHFISPFLQQAAEITIVCFITGANPPPFLPQILVPDISSKPWPHPQGRRDSCIGLRHKVVACRTWILVYEPGIWQWFMTGVQLEESVTQPLFQVLSDNNYSEPIYIHHIVTFGRTGNRSWNPVVWWLV